MKTNKTTTMIFSFIFSLAFLVGCSDDTNHIIEGGEENTFYIDAENGNDFNEGTSPQNAWKSVEAASARFFPPGATIRIKGGCVYQGTFSFKGSGSEQDPILITSYGEGMAVIDGSSNKSAISLYNQSNIILTNLEVKNSVSGYEEKNTIQRNGIYISGDKGIISNITVKDCHIHEVFGTVIRPYFYDNAGINIRYTVPSDENNKFHNILIENCTVEDVRTIGIRIGDGASGTGDSARRPYSTKFIVRNTLIQRTGADGMIIQSCNQPLVEYVKCFDAGYYAVKGEEYEGTECLAGIWSCATESPTFQFNEIGRTRFVLADGQAFDTDWGTSGVVIWQYNYTHDNEGGVLLRHRDYDGIFRYNISINDGHAIDGKVNPLIFHSLSEPNAGVTTYYNNLFYNNRNEMIISEGYENYPEVITVDAENNVFCNNIFVFRNDVDFGLRTVFENNCYYNVAGLLTVSPDRDNQKVIGNPQFSGVLPESLDAAVVGEIFQLSVNSICKGAGKLIENNGGQDYNGKTLGSSSVSIGAIE